MMRESKHEYYKKWYETLSLEDKKKEDEYKYNKGASESEDRIGKQYYAIEYEKLIKKNKVLALEIVRKPELEIVLALEIVGNEDSEINFIDLDEMIDEAPMKTLIKKGGSRTTLEKINEKI